MLHLMSFLTAWGAVLPTLGDNKMQKIIGKKTGREYFLPSIKELKEADSEMQGFCIACGEIADGVEPDAAKYECECCGQDKVYGAAEFALRGWIAG